MKGNSMTKKQLQQYNKMFLTLKKIAKSYSTASQIRKSCDKEWGLEYEEALEMSYENIQEEAKQAIKGVKIIEES